jgi:hypothetical protein
MSLSEIDRVYQAVMNEMSVKEKIIYCSRLIYRTHTQLTRQGAHLTSVTKQQSMQLLEYARFELDQLLKTRV